jgi:hypothetical protein
MCWLKSFLTSLIYQPHFSVIDFFIRLVYEYIMVISIGMSGIVQIGVIVHQSMGALLW